MAVKHITEKPAGLSRRVAARRAGRVYAALLKEYGQPVWRNKLPALDELVSTILSQNTNDINRDRAFEALRARFSSWEAVRDAPETEVVAAIRPAGLANQKGPRIQQVLRAITQQRGALDLDFLRDLPPTTAIPILKACCRPTPTLPLTSTSSGTAARCATRCGPSARAAF